MKMNFLGAKNIAKKWAGQTVRHHYKALSLIPPPLNIPPREGNGVVEQPVEVAFGLNVIYASYMLPERFAGRQSINEEVVQEIILGSKV